MKSVELVLKIGARVGEMVKGMTTASNSVTKVQQVIEKLNSKKIDIVANDSEVLRVKKSLDSVDDKLNNLKKIKAKLYLQLDKQKVSDINSHIRKVNDKIKDLEDKEHNIELKIKATTDEKELKKLNKSLENTRKKIVGLSDEKLGLNKELEKVKESNEKVNEKLKQTKKLTDELNAKKLNLKDELKEVQKEALETNNTIRNIEKTVNRLNGTTLKIKQTIERREILKTELLGNVQKITGMGLALGGVALGIDRINKSTVQMANLADTVGLSFNTVNALGGAVKGIGLNYEHITDIMEELNNKIGESKVKYADWLKEDKGKGKELKLVGSVDDAFKGLDFSLSDKSFKNLNYEEQFKKFSGLKGDKQFEIVIDTALKMKDQQKAASMVDILMGGEANKILSFLRKQGKSYSQFMEDKKKMIFLDEEGILGAKAYAKVSATSVSIVGSIFQQFSGIGGGFMSPLLNKFNKWLVVNKKIVKSNIKGFFTGVKSALGSVGNGIDYVYGRLKPLTNLLGITSDEANKAGESGKKIGKSLAYIGAGLGGILALKIAIGATRIATGYATNGVRLFQLGYLKLNAVALATRGSTALSMLSFKNLGKVAKATSKILLRSPWGIAIAGIALGAVMIRKYWEPIKGFFGGVVSGIGDALGTMQTIFATAFGAIEHHVRPIIDVLRPIGDVFQMVFGTAVGYIEQLIKPLSSVSDSVASATANGRSFGQWIGYVGAGVGGVLALKGAFAVLAPAISVVGGVLAFFTRALLMNPIGLAVTAIAGGAYLIYSNWGAIKEWFGSLWSGVKSIFSSAWNGLKSAISWNPLTTIQTNFMQIIEFFNGFSLKEAGANIISSVVDGFMSKVEYLKGKVSSITSTIREYFPFSPAKRGALRDIHKIKLMETVASGLSERPLLKAVNKTTMKMRKSLALAGVGVALSGSLAVASPVLSEPISQQNEFKTKVFNRDFETKENLLTKSLPSLQNRTFDTVENLKLNNIGNVADRSFKTKELLETYSMPKVKAEEFRMPGFVDTEDAAKETNTKNGTKAYYNNSTIHVTMGDIIVQSTDGKLAEPQLLREEVQQLVEDGIRQAQENLQDRHFYDIGGLG